jgi:hypothetical protein
MPAEAVAWLCEHIGQLRDRAEFYGMAREVEALVAAVQVGRDVTADEVRGLSRKLDGPEPDLRSAPRIPGVGEGEPPRVEYRCPHGRCGRTGRRTPGGPAPVCRLTGDQMTVKAISG